MNNIVIKRGESRTIINFLTAEGAENNATYTLEQGASLFYTEVTCTKGVAQSNITFECERDSSLKVNTVDIDNVEFSRSQTFNLNNENIEVDVVGIYLSGENETVNNSLRMNHLKPHCQSSQNYKGVVANRASFNGHIYIERNAQQTVALQENNNILLNDNAKVETHPWLEIYADDVKCNHGATVGKNDEQALYYMRQRGISQGEAKKLLLQGFIEQCVMESEKSEEIKHLIEEKLKTL